MKIDKVYYNKSMKLFNLFTKEKDITCIVEQEFRENFGVLKSLEAYDKGEKHISTTDIKKHLPNIRTTTS